jgi:lipopolysaccharide/colanic/teichoic acid biosynthesis glycosyltransferase
MLLGDMSIVGPRPLSVRDAVKMELCGETALQREPD